MKKVLCLVVALVSAASFAIYASSLSKDADVKSTIVSLSESAYEIPADINDLGEYDADKRTTHWYKDYTDSFITAEDYVTVKPFKGDSGKGYGSCYGLMAADGRIVTDAVYTQVFQTEFSGEKYFVLIRSKLTAGEFNREVINSDGTVIFKMKNSAASAEKGRIIVGSCEKDFNGVYNYNGKKLIEFPMAFDYADYAQGVYCCSYSVGSITKSIAYSEEGDVIFELENTAIRAFKNGYAVARMEYILQDGGSYGIVNLNGNWVKTPIYNSIDLTQDGYVMNGRTKTTMCDYDLNLIVK